jgi:hypothetical protein
MNFKVISKGIKGFVCIITITQVGLINEAQSAVESYALFQVMVREVRRWAGCGGARGSEREGASADCGYEGREESYV